MEDKQITKKSMKASNYLNRNETVNTSPNSLKKTYHRYSDESEDIESRGNSGESELFILRKTSTRV